MNILHCLICSRGHHCKRVVLCCYRDDDSNSEVSSSPSTIMEFREVQPTIDLSISLSELWAGCSTVLVDVTPWCLFTNICQLDLVLMGAEDRSFQVPKGSTISPPKIEVHCFTSIVNFLKDTLIGYLPIFQMLLKTSLCIRYHWFPFEKDT